MCITKSGGDCQGPRATTDYRILKRIACAVTDSGRTNDQTLGARLVDFYVRRDSGLLWRSAARCNVHLGGAGAARRGLDEVKGHFRAYQETAVKAVSAAKV